MKRFFPILLFLGLGVAFAFALTRDPRKLDSVIIDQAFPEFVLSSLHAPNEMLSQDMLKGRVSLINVFGSWCISCNYEHPVLMDIGKTSSVDIIGINWRDDRTKAKTWLSDKGDPYNEIIFDPESILIIPLGVVGAPETFITDKAGQIRYKHTGPLTPQIWRKTLKPLINQLETEL